jgi:hypothetical protein
MLTQTNLHITENKGKEKGKIKPNLKHYFFFLPSLFLQWLILHLYDENKLGVSWSIWWWSG